MGLFRQLAEKPWQVQTADGSVSNEGSAFPIHRRAVAMYVFLAIVGVLFFLIVAAYHMRIVFSTDWVALPEPTLLWVNTCVLVVCSLAFQRARSTIRRDLIDRARFAFLLAGVLTLVFLAGQMIVWKQLVGMGYFVSTSPANSFLPHYGGTRMSSGRWAGGMGPGCGTYARPSGGIRHNTQF